MYNLKVKMLNFNTMGDVKKIELGTEARIIQKMIAAKKGGAKTQAPNSKKPKLYHCDTVGE